MLPVCTMFTDWFMMFRKFKHYVNTARKNTERNQHDINLVLVIMILFSYAATLCIFAFLYLEMNNGQ